MELSEQPMLAHVPIQAESAVAPAVAMTTVVSFRGRNKRFPLIRSVLGLETQV